MSSISSKTLAIALALAFAVLALGVGLLLIVKPFSDSGHAAGAKSAGAPIAATFDGSDYYDAADAQTTPTAALERDPEEKYASPESADAKPHRIADMPAASTTKRPSAGGTSAELRKELKDGGGGDDQVSLASDGSAVPPIGAPDSVQGVITAANAIRSFPYIWGGGHGSFQARGYDCSGSVSYALAGGGLLGKPMTSGRFEKWGEPGKGKWITIYANGGHMFMIVGGLRYDTSFRDGPRGTRWQDAPRSMKGFTVRHWPGL